MLSIKDFLGSIETWGKLKLNRELDAVEKLKILKELEQRVNTIARVINLQDSELIAKKYKESVEAGEEMINVLDIMRKNKPLSLEQQDVFRKLVQNANAYASYAETYAITKFSDSDKTRLIERKDDSFNNVDKYYFESNKIIKELRLKLK